MSALARQAKLDRVALSRALSGHFLAAQQVDELLQSSIRFSIGSHGEAAHVFLLPRPPQEKERPVDIVRAAELQGKKGEREAEPLDVDAGLPVQQARHARPEHVHSCRPDYPLVLHRHFAGVQCDVS